MVAIAYILTGAALVNYDFAAPPLHRKGYVIQQDLRLAFILWFLWPYSASKEAYEESRLGRSGLRFMLGIIVVAIGVFFWVWLLFSLSMWLLNWQPIAYLVAAVVGFVSCPIFAFIAMPKHGGSRWPAA